MTDLFYAAYLALVIIVVADILKKIQTPVARFLWVFCAIALPLLGPGLWVYVHYVAPAQKRLEKEEKRRMRDKR